MKKPPFSSLSRPGSLRALLTLAMIGLVGISSSRAETFTDAGSRIWNGATNWVPASVPNGTGAVAVFNTPLVNQTIDLTGTSAGGGITVGSITFNSTSTTNINIRNGSGGGPLIFDEIGTGPATLTTTGTGTGSITISATMTFTDSLTVIANHMSTSFLGVFLSGFIDGPGGLTKEGDGLLTFSTTAHNYTGPTVLNGGRTRMIPGQGGPAKTTNFTVNAGAQLYIESGSGNFGFGNLNLNGIGAISGPYAAFPGAIRCQPQAPLTSTSAELYNAIVLQSDTLLHVQGAGSFLSLMNKISGPGKLTLTGQPHDANLGTLLLNNRNTYSGGTVVEGGTLMVIPGIAKLGTGDVTVNSASASFSGSSAKLQIQSGAVDVIADTATLCLAGGNVPGVADDGYVVLGPGVNEVVGALKLGGVIQPAGTYGSTTSTATFKNDEYFSGAGIITVLPPSLTITLTLPDAVLSWPTNAVDYTLQFVPVLSEASNWTNVDAPVVVSGMNNTVTVPATNINYFRLTR